MQTKRERIEQINLKIIELQKDRNRAARYDNWPEEQSLDDQIIELEKQIKQIEAE